MKRILFLLLWAVLAQGTQARGAPIEIYANGHKYASFQSYLESKNPVAVPPKVSQKGLSDAALHKLYVLSVENGVAGALRDFYETRAQFDLQMAHKISSEQLQEAIAQAVAKSKDPKLLISRQGKVRIMSIFPDNSKQ